jgi:hypothetical protein
VCEGCVKGVSSLSDNRISGSHEIAALGNLLSAEVYGWEWLLPKSFLQDIPTYILGAIEVIVAENSSQLSNCRKTGEANTMGI